MDKENFEKWYFLVIWQAFFKCWQPYWIWGKFQGGSEAYLREGGQRYINLLKKPWQEKRASLSLHGPVNNSNGGHLEFQNGHQLLNLWSKLDCFILKNIFCNLNQLIWMPITKGIGIFVIYLAAILNINTAAIFVLMIRLLDIKNIWFATKIS